MTITQITAASIRQDFAKLIDFKRVLQLFIETLLSWKEQCDNPYNSDGSKADALCKYKWLSAMHQSLIRIFTLNSSNPNAEHFAKLYDEWQRDLEEEEKRGNDMKPSGMSGLLEALEADHTQGMPASALKVLEKTLLLVAIETDGVPIEACFNCQGCGGEPCDNIDGHQGDGTCCACHGVCYVTPEENVTARKEVEPAVAE